MKSLEVLNANLNLKFCCEELKSTFVITEVKLDASFKGEFQMAGIVIPIVGYSHPNTVNPNVDFCFSGNSIDPNAFVGGSGRFSVYGVPTNITIGGAYPNDAMVVTFNGNYTLCD